VTRSEYVSATSASGTGESLRPVTRADKAISALQAPRAAREQAD
jgi:hypothetical protein